MRVLRYNNTYHIPLHSLHDYAFTARCGQFPSCFKVFELKSEELNLTHFERLCPKCFDFETMMKIAIRLKKNI
jgi:hypothetical protein